MSYSLLIEGFKTEAQRDEFVTWYGEQGEQDSSAWFEEAAHEIPEMDGVKFMSLASHPPFRKDTERLIITLNMHK